LKNIYNPFIENGVLEFIEKKIFKRGFVWKVSKKNYFARISPLANI
jgi:hypothetical protein